MESIEKMSVSLEKSSLDLSGMTFSQNIKDDDCYLAYCLPVQQKISQISKLNETNANTTVTQDNTNFLNDYYNDNRSSI
jgi:hypothetical protein